MPPGPATVFAPSALNLPPPDFVNPGYEENERPLGQRKRDSYISTTEKVMKHDLEKLKSVLEACSIYIL